MRSLIAPCVAAGNLAQQIIAMEQGTDADLKVVGKHETQIAEELLIGSVTQHALAESQCDSLANCDPHDAPKSSP